MYIHARSPYSDCVNLLKYLNIKARGALQINVTAEHNKSLCPQTSLRSRCACALRGTDLYVIKPKFSIAPAAKSGIPTKFSSGNAYGTPKDEEKVCKAVQPADRAVLSWVTL